MKKKTFIILAIIFAIGIFLRFYRLGLNIPNLYSDETLGHYMSWVRMSDPSLSLFSKIFLAIKTAPDSLTWLFGLSVFGARLPSALYGSFLILAAYLFGLSVSKINFGSKANLISLVMAGLIAVLPWSFMMSRLYATFSFILILVCLHIYLYVKAKKTVDYLTCLIPLIIASCLYSSMVIIVPLGSLLVYYDIWKISDRQQKIKISFSALFLFFAAIVFFSYRFHIFEISSRGLDLAIWRDENTTYETDKYRGLSWNSQPAFFSFNIPPENLADKIFYNRLVANVSIFARNYLSFFSPDWLFLKGDPILRHSIGVVGEFYPFLIPLLIYGIYIFSLKSDKKTKRLFIFWIIISPIPAAITKDGYGYLLRVITMMPFLTFLCGLGIVESFNLFKDKWKYVYGIYLGLVALYSINFFFFNYFHVYPALSERSYEYGFKQLSDFQENNGNKSLLVLWDGYYHNSDFRFWQQTTYEQYMSFKLKKISIGSSDFWQTFPNLYFSSPKKYQDYLLFVKQYRPSYIVLPDTYFVKYPQEIETSLGKPTEIIYNPDQSPALKIYLSQ